MPHWTQPRAAASAQLMIRVARDYGMSSDDCITGTGLVADDLVDPEREIEGQQELGVVRNMLQTLGPTVPFCVTAGLRYHLTTHGMWGFAMLSARSIRDAIDVSVRYFDLSYSFNRLSFEVDGSYGHLVYDDSDNADDLRALLIERDLAAAITIQEDMIGYAIPFPKLQLRAPRPAYADELERVLRVKPQYNAAINCASIALSTLEIAPAMADDLGLRVCQERCQTLLDQRRARAGFAGRLRRRILIQPGQVPSMSTIAAELCMSTRTLRNKLTREGTSYRELVEEVREELAEQLLFSPMKVDSIARRLGYADSSSFIAAFKRWKGVPPRGYARGA